MKLVYLWKQGLCIKNYRTNSWKNACISLIRNKTTKQKVQKTFLIYFWSQEQNLMLWDLNFQPPLISYFKRIKINIDEAYYIKQINTLQLLIISTAQMLSMFYD